MFHPSPTTPGSAGSASAQSSQSVEVLEYSTQPLSQVEVDSDEEAPVNLNQSTKSKWSVEEDDLLISGWLNTSLDSIKGKGQKEDAFWARVRKYIVHNSNTPIRRTKDTIKSRWSRINKDVCRFVGCYEEANRTPQSGENTDNVLARAHVNFVPKYNRNFTLAHCWAILKHEPKWMNIYISAKPTAPTSESGSGSKRSRDTTEFREEHQSPVRPIGRDAAKRQKGKTVARKLAGDDAEDVAAREAASREALEQAGLIRNRQLDIEMAKIEKRSQDRKMEVLVALLNKQTLTPLEEETKERLLKLL